MDKQKPQFIKCSEVMNHNDKLVEIFVRCDDFYQEFEKFLQDKGISYPIKKNAVLKTVDCHRVKS